MLKKINQTDLVAEGDAFLEGNNRILLHEGWSFRQENNKDWLQATVPGCNFTDLLDNNKIQDPFYGDNENRLQWIENENWEYKCSFNVEDELLNSPEIELVFEGLDTYCEVTLNGHRILEANNMFLEYKILCREYLQYGSNELFLKFRSPILETTNTQKQLGIIYPAENDKSQDKLSVFTRKAPYHYGWDWGPRFVTSGVWRPIYIQPVYVGRISNLQVHQHWLASDQVKLDFELEITALANFSGMVVLTSNQTDHEIKKEIFFNTTLNSSKLSITISNPERWWPNGLGKAFLYDFTAELLVNDAPVSTVEQRVGLRTVEVINEPDEHGESFYLKVNGHPVFMKGANHIPLNSFLPSITRKRYEQLFHDVRDANMNMLRVWGGGVYEDDLFYELADENGILVWQDFMFSCTLYPASDDFIQNVKEEAIYNIKRLRNHASLALWCGNNEIEMGIDKWDWQEKFDYSNEQYDILKKDYHFLFKELLPELVTQYDYSRFYFSSSPIGFWEIESDDNKGDNHYWGVWHGEEDFDAYRKRVPRFMSEYGFQSFPLEESVNRFIDKKDQNIDSIAMNVHQKHARGNRIINDTILKNYNSPKDFKSFLYLSQLVQAAGLKVAFESHRNAMPFCMGTLYWQLNDCWPVASWSGMDYYGKWKALHYQAKRSFGKYLVSAEEKGKDIIVRTVSDCLTKKEALLKIEWRSIKGCLLEEKQLNLTLHPNAVQEVLKENVNEIPSSSFCYIMTLTVDGEVACKNIFHLNKTRFEQLPEPDISWSLSKERNVVALHLSSSSFVKNLYVDFEGIKGNLSDNFFDLIPDEPIIIYYNLSEGEELGEPSFLSVYDTY